MVRRDEIVEKLSKYNSTSVVQQQIDDLEKYIDSELQKESNIRKWINSSNIGSEVLGSLELVKQTNLTNSVHKDITINGDDRVTIEKVSYVEWNEDTEKYITTKNGEDASTQPWNDRTIAEGEFNGTLTIECPVGTNKNTAFLLAKRYMKIGEFDSEGNPISGFWSNAIKPNDENNKNQTGDILEDAVIVLYDVTTDKVYMRFKLF